MHTSDFTFSQKGYKITVNDCVLGELQGEEIHSSGYANYTLNGIINWFNDKINLHIYLYPDELEEALNTLRTVYLDREIIFPKIKAYCVSELEIFKKECEEETSNPVILPDFLTNMQVQSLNIFLPKEIEMNFLYDETFYVSACFDIEGNCYYFDCDIYIG